jgi:hypothetical protein
MPPPPLVDALPEDQWLAKLAADAARREEEAAVAVAAEAARAAAEAAAAEERRGAEAAAARRVYLARVRSVAFGLATLKPSRCCSGRVHKARPGHPSTCTIQPPQLPTTAHRSPRLWRKPSRSWPPR